MTSKTNELFHKPTSLETESIIKTNTDLSTSSSFATIAGIKGEQFGKDIYSSILKFKDLKNFLETFSEVQRSVSPRKVAKIKTYILSKLEDDSLMRFFSALTVTIRSNAFYDEKFKQLAIDTNKSKLSINDGQHRFLGIIATLEDLSTKRNKAKLSEEVDFYNEAIEKLENMVIPVVIFSGMSEDEEKQLFFDLNSLAQRPSRNANIKLSQTDIISRMARELANKNKNLIRYGVEFEKNSIHKNNNNFILLTTIYNFIKIIYTKQVKSKTDFMTDDNFDYYFNKLNKTLDMIFESLPKDLHTKDKYILNKNFSFRGIAQFLFEMDYLEKDKAGIEILMKSIENVNWKAEHTYWMRYGATISQTGLLVFPGNGEGGVNSIKKAIVDQYRKL